MKNVDAEGADHRGYSYDEIQDVVHSSGEKAIPTCCGMCGPRTGCGIYAIVKNDRFVKVAGMKESPVNRGSVCAKGLSAPQWVYSPERLTKPLLRTGDRGEGKFAEITWDKAISIIARKLTDQKKTYGPESLGILSPARRTYSDLMQRFLVTHGSPNYGHSGICAMQRAFAFSYTLGTRPQSDYKNADLILIWGRQPFYSGPTLHPARNYVEAKNRGAKIIAIKPSIEPDSGKADYWLPIRPGTDAALALSMVHVIIVEDLIDREFIETWCYGFDELKEHIQKYPPSWGEKITGISAAQISETARLYAGTQRATIDVGNGLEHAPSASDAIRSIAIMMAITGHLDRPGTNLFPGETAGGNRIPKLKSIGFMERYTPDMIKNLVGPEFPRPFQPFIEGATSAYYRILDSVLTEKPYPIRTILAPGTQPLVSTRGSKRVLQALKKVEFFVTIDVTRPAEMNYADIVLPTTTPYESNYPFDARGNWIMARRKVIEPPGDFKSIHEFFLDLAVAMGYGDDFWQGSMDEFQKEMIEPFGMTVEELESHPIGVVFEDAGKKEYEKYDKTFRSKSTNLHGEPYLQQGKVALYNTNFESKGFAPLPTWHEPPESLTGTPELAKRFPLVLSDYHTSKAFSASWQRNVPELRNLLPHPTLHIHPSTAAKRGIDDGDWIIVESPHGWLKLQAELYPGIRPDTVMMLHGWWQGCKELGFDDLALLDGGANVNNLYSVDPNKAFDPLVTAMSSQTLVQVHKAGSLEKGEEA